MSTHVKGKYYDDDTTQIIMWFVLLFGLMILIHHDYTGFYKIWIQIITPVVKVIAWINQTFWGPIFNTLLNTTHAEGMNLVVFLKKIHPNQLSFQTFLSINHFVGKYLLLILFPLGWYYVVKVFRLSYGLDRSFKNFRNYQEFKKYTQPQNIVQFSYSEMKSSMLPQNMQSALSSIEFCQQHHLISYDHKDRMESVDQYQLHQVFTQQLGKRFVSKKTLLDSSLGWVVTHLMQMIPEPYREDILSEMVQTHLYETTICMGLLNQARRFGVVPLHDFIPLKQQNRALWYALASLGRRTVFVEGAGIFAQFKHEIFCIKKMKKTPIPDSVDAAVLGVLQALKEHENFSETQG